MYHWCLLLNNPLWASPHDFRIPGCVQICKSTHALSHDQMQVTNSAHQTTYTSHPTQWWEVGDKIIRQQRKDVSTSSKSCVNIHRKHNILDPDLMKMVQIFGPLFKAIFTKFSFIHSLGYLLLPFTLGLIGYLYETFAQQHFLKKVCACNKLPGLVKGVFSAFEFLREMFNFAGS